MVRFLSDADIRGLVDLETLLPVVAKALEKQARGAVERPDRSHFPVGRGLKTEEHLGTGLAMSAYVHRADHYATKIVGVHEDNPSRGLETVNATLVLTSAETGRLVAVFAGNLVTNTRRAVSEALPCENSRRRQ